MARGRFGFTREMTWAKLSGMMMRRPFTALFTLAIMAVLAACAPISADANLAADHEIASTAIQAARITATVNAARLETTLSYSGTRVAFAATQSQFLKATLSGRGTDIAVLEAFQERVQRGEIALPTATARANATSVADDSGGLLPAFRTAAPTNLALRASPRALQITQIATATASPLPPPPTGEPTPFILEALPTETPPPPSVTPDPDALPTFTPRPLTVTPTETPAPLLFDLEDDEEPGALITTTPDALLTPQDFVPAAQQAALTSTAAALNNPGGDDDASASDESADESPFGVGVGGGVDPPRMRNITIAGQVNNEGCPTDRQNSFTPRSPAIYMVVLADYAPPGTVFESIWAYQGEEIASYDFELEQAVEEVCVWFRIVRTEIPFERGQWTATLWINGQAASRPLPFTIE